ncbi:MAG: DUF402 domain-containing protein, partial [Thermoplasmatota archaeon]
ISSFVFRLPKPFTHHGEILIEDGYQGVMFDLLDRYYNVVKIWDEEGHFRGYYSDIRTPPKKIKNGYKAVDLFLDIWLDREGHFFILDEDEFEEAELSEEITEKALETKERLIEDIKNGDYPPSPADGFQLE